MWGGTLWFWLAFSFLQNTTCGCVAHIGEGNGNPLQYSCLENPMDGGAWKAAVHGVSEGRTELSDFTFTFHFQALEKEMATHSSVLAWRIPGTREPGGLSMGSHRVRHDWSDLAAAATIIQWVRYYYSVCYTDEQRGYTTCPKSASVKGRSEVCTQAILLCVNF